LEATSLVWNARVGYNVVCIPNPDPTWWEPCLFGHPYQLLESIGVGIFFIFKS